MYEFNIETIPSGKFYVSDSIAKTLRAYLGSCVGVVIVDRKAGVGGLLHILLPEPVTKASVDEPEKYASTAVPLFIEALTNKGAQLPDMRAWICGGSLVGQVSMMDLKLDIGGQSAEIVENYLKFENIKIEKIETGGYLSSQMSLNLNKLECKIEPILDAHPALKTETQEPVAPDIEQALQMIKPIPQIALKVIRMINSKQITMRSIADEIRQDQVLAAKVLQLTNSAYINPGRHIESIDRALVLLGDKRILLLTLSVFTEMFYQQAENGYSLIKGGLFKHATDVGFLAEKLALLSGKVETDLAFTAGLLHDIGKTVLDQAMAAEYPLFYRKITENTHNDLLGIEKEVFGVDHNEIGAKLAEKWSLPPALAEAISFHHQPEKATHSRELTHIVFLSNILSHCYSAGKSVATTYSYDINETLAVLGLDKKKLERFIDSIQWGADEDAYLNN